LNPVASAHHEKCTGCGVGIDALASPIANWSQAADGSGSHKRLRAATADPGACVLPAAEI
jgi:hypothetical protein